MNNTLPQSVTENPRYRLTHPQPELGKITALTSGTRLRLTVNDGTRTVRRLAAVPTEGLLYWLTPPLNDSTSAAFRLDSWDSVPELTGDPLLGTTETTVESFEILEPGPKIPFNWPNEDLKNLVKAAPASPYTRALLRVKFNKPLPPEALTFEAIEEFLATLPPPAIKASALKYPTPAPTTGRRSESDELRAGEYVEVEGTREGYTHSTENWTKNATVRVPLSVFENGPDAVEDYVREWVDDNAECDYGDSDYGGSEYGDFNLDTDLDDAMTEAEEKIAERDGTNNDEDED